MIELGVLGIVGLILIVYAIIRVVDSDASALGKAFWIVILIAFPFVGFILWLVFGPTSRRRPSSV